MRLLTLLFAGLLALAPLSASAQLSAATQAQGGGADGGQASGAEGSAAQVADEQLQKLIDTLQDPAARQQLVDNLQALLQANRQAQPAGPLEDEKTFGAGALETVVGAMSDLSAQLVDAAGSFAELPDAAIEGIQALESPEVQRRFLEVAVTLIAIAAGGLLVEFLVARLLARPRRTLDDKPADSWAVRLLYLVLRLLLDLVPIAAFAATTYGILTLADTTRTTDLVALAFINANVLDRAVRLVGRLVLVPQNRGQRLLPLEDETAHYLYLWLRRFSFIGIYGFMATQMALTLGLDPAAQALLVNLLALLLAAMLIMFILQQRKEVTAWLKGSQAGSGAIAGVRARLAEIWHVLAIFYVAGCWFIFVLDIEGGFGFLARATVLTLLILAGTRLAILLLGQAIERGFRLDEETRQRFPLLQERANRYLPVLRAVLSTGIGLLSLLLLLEVWGAEPFGWLVSEPGRAFSGVVVKILLVIGGGFAIWEITSSLIESYLRGRPGGRSARTTTLLKLFQNALRIILAVLVVLIVLSEVGLDIAPLLAGAGVIGLAIGFGAQTLVKDVITGVFMLMENTIAVGDVVELGGKTGVVEQISIRTAHLRDLEGNLHVIPFSDSTAVTNYGRGFSYALVDMGVSYREDVDEVIAVLKEEAAKLRQEEEFKGVILDDLEVLGLNSFGASEIVVRVRLKTVPLSQWSVKRAYYARIKKAFDAKGIEIPFPHQTIYFGVDKDGSAPPLHLVREPSAEELEDQQDEADEADETPGAEGLPAARRRPSRRRRTQDLPDVDGDD